MEKEEWRPVVGYEGWYEVSSMGRVRSLDRLIIFVNGKKRVYHGKILSACVSHSYKHVVLCKNKEKKNKFVHVLVALSFPEICGEFKKGLTVDHLDGDKLNNSAINLKFKTLSQNMRNPNTWDKKIKAALANLKIINSRQSA